MVEVGGEPVLSLGGTQNSEGTSGGALLDTGTTLPAEAQVAPWEASVSDSDTTRSAKGSAAVARADAPGVVQADVLESESEASHRPLKSTGSGSSNGADVTLLDAIRLVLLHSEVNSEGKGSSFLVGLNELTLGTGDELADLCALDVSPVVGLSCLTASGGVGDDGIVAGAAKVAGATSETVTPVSPIAAFAVEGASGTGEALPAPVTPPATASTDTARALPESAPAQVAGATETGGSSLPRTGVAASVLALLAVMAVAIGTALRMAARRGVIA